MTVEAPPNVKARKGKKDEGSKPSEAAVPLPEEVQSEPPKFVRPFVTQGQTVHWYPPGAGKAPSAAIVTYITEGGVSLCTLPREGFVVSRFVPQVYHRDDPQCTAEHRARNGCWTLTQVDEAHREVSRAVLQASGIDPRALSKDARAYLGMAGEEGSDR